MCYIFFIHSSLDGHLGCFRVLTIVNSAVMNTGVLDGCLLIRGRNQLVGKAWTELKKQLG